MADISYTRTTWADGSEGGTPIDATKLNNIEQGIVDAVAAIGPNDTTEDGTLKAQIDQNTSDIETLQESVSPDGPHTLANGATYSKIGRLCILKFSSYSSQGGGIGNLPAGYRPVDYIAVPVYSTGTSGYVDVSPSGDVTTSAIGDVFGEVVYIVQAS